MRITRNRDRGSQGLAFTDDARLVVVSRRNRRLLRWTVELPGGSFGVGPTVRDAIDQARGAVYVAGVEFHEDHEAKVLRVDANGANFQQVYSAMARHLFGDLQTGQDRDPVGDQ